MTITRKMVRRQFEIFCETFGYTIGNAPGNLGLDYYNGYQVIQYGERGSEHGIFGYDRYTAREMFHCLQFSMRAMQGRKFTPIISAHVGYPLGEVNV